MFSTQNCSKFNVNNECEIIKTLITGMCCTLL